VDSRVKMVVLTHVGGWVAKDYEKIARFCKQNHLILLEDCAHVFGVTAAGTLGDAACWSFYPTKAVPIGEGGAVSSTNKALLEFVDKFRNYGKVNRGTHMDYQRGFNLRMSEWDAAVLRVQLEVLPEVLAARRRDAEKLQSIAKCLLEGESNYYKYPVAPHEGAGMRQVGKVYGLTDQLASCLPTGCDRGKVSLKHSEEWAENHVCLPIGEGLYDQYSVDEVKELLCKQQ
jgi:perosamine synthetase